jgi:hypothetical protein
MGLVGVEAGVKQRAGKVTAARANARELRLSRIVRDFLVQQ